MSPESVPNKPTLTMPPEWAPQAATWLSFPINGDTWSQNLAAAQAEFALLVHAIAADQKAYVMCGGEKHRETARAIILDQSVRELTAQQIENIELVDIATNDAWARDYAPTFVKSNEPDGPLYSVDWHYNAWGGKYPPFDLDQQVAGKVAERLEIENVAAGICAEGGALEINGKGVLLVTRSSVLNENRNPEVDQTHIEAVFRKFLGAKQIVWLPGDQIGPTVLGDDTDGHIDQLARFAGDSTIVYAWTEQANDPQRAGMENNLTELKRQMKALDARYQFVPLPLPPAITHCDLRLPASYCNFLITNQCVLVPQFGVAASDAQALGILSPLFPDRRLVPLPSKELAVGLGSFHCLSQQQPA